VGVKRICIRCCKGNEKSVAVVFVAATGTFMLQSASGPFFFNDEMLRNENILLAEPKTRDSAAKKRSIPGGKDLLLSTQNLPSQTCPTERN
jgi:hypothetical protein